MFVFGKSRLLLPLLLLLPHNNQGMDGCQWSGVWKCGDVCTNNKAQCTCGNSTFMHGDGKWCCGTNCSGGKCLQWEEKEEWVNGELVKTGEYYKEGDAPWYCAEWSPAICTIGVALNLTESCSPKYKCNENQQDEYRNYRSSRSYLAACSDNRTCVKEGEGRTYSEIYKPMICTGDSSCEGELAWCKKEERKNEICPDGFTRCLPTLGGGKKKEDSETNGIPGQCIDEQKQKDGNYHCIDRTDENPFKEAENGTKQKKIDFEKLKICKTGYHRDPGLQCSGSEKSNCIKMFYWCNDKYSKECPVLGSGICTNNLEICQDYKFWQDKPCEKDYIRCRAGYSGQCVQKYYWGVEGAKDYYGTDVSCKDGSDLYGPIVKGEEPGRQPSQQQVWKTKPVAEDFYNKYYKGQERAANYTKESTTGLWMIPESDPFKVPSITEEDLEKGPRAFWNGTIVGEGEGEWERKEEFANFYSSDKYNDETTNRRVAAPTEETCKANNGFVCKVAGVETCFKDIAKCDFHAQCDPAEGSDTAEDELNCDEEYRKKRLIPKQATYRCQSPIHNEESVQNNKSLGVVWIRAALNDGNPECWKREDEIERSSDWVKYVFPVIFFAVLVVVTICTPTILQICFRNGKDFQAPPGGDTTLKILVEGSTAEVKKLIAEQRISSSLAQLQKLDLPRERRRRINQKIVISLAAGRAKAFAKLKRLARKETAQEIIDDFTHSLNSCMGKVKDIIGDLKDSMKEKYDAMSCSCSTGNGCCGRCQYEVQCCSPGPQPTADGLFSSLSRLRKAVAPYIDLAKDSVLVALLISIGGIQAFFFDDNTLFSNLLIKLLLATVAVPLFASAVQTSSRHPLTIFEFSVWSKFTADRPSKNKLAFIRLLVFSCYIFVPAILTINKEKAKLQKQILEEKGKEEYDSKDGIVTNKTLEEQEQIEVYLDEVRKAHLLFKRNEAALELVAQQSIQLTMLLLSMTKYPVVTGLQGMFGKDYSNISTAQIDENLGLSLNENLLQLSSMMENSLGVSLGDVLLLLSVSWSFKTGIVTFLNIHSEQKSGMLSGAAKLVLGLRALLFSVTRIICVVAFFGPFLGLGDCMSHWHAEEIQLDQEILNNLWGNTSYWDRETVDLMYRPQLDQPTNYTLVTLQQAFFIFLGILLLHGIAIFILKMSVSSHFKSAGWLNKIGHVVESLHVPDVYKDFDFDMNPEEERTPEDYRKSYDSVLKETVWMTSLQMLSNLLLLVPLHVTAYKVSERHLVLVDNIGTFAEEDEAYELLNKLSITLPIVAMVTWVLDALLGYVYLKWCHPWKILLQEEPNQWEPETDDEGEMEQEDTAGSATAEAHEDSPLLGRPSEVKVGLELHSCASSHQVDQVGEVTKEEEKDSEESGEEETKV